MSGIIYNYSPGYRGGYYKCSSNMVQLDSSLSPKTQVLPQRVVHKHWWDNVIYPFWKAKSHSLFNRAIFTFLPLLCQQ